MAVGEMLGWGLDQVRQLSTYEFNLWIEWMTLKAKEVKKASRR